MDSGEDSGWDGDIRRLWDCDVELWGGEDKDIRYPDIKQGYKMGFKI